MTPKFFNRPKLFWVAAAILLLSGAAYSARVGVRHVRSRINEARAEVVKRDAKIADLNGKLVNLNGKLEKTTRSTQERMMTTLALRLVRKSPQTLRPISFDLFAVKAYTPAR